MAKEGWQSRRHEGAAFEECWGRIEPMDEKQPRGGTETVHLPLRTKTIHGECGQGNPIPMRDAKRMTHPHHGEDKRKVKHPPCARRMQEGTKAGKQGEGRPQSGYETCIPPSGPTQTYSPFQWVLQRVDSPAVLGREELRICSATAFCKACEVIVRILRT